MSYLASQGVVAVRYEAKGCNVELEVLSNCIGKGKYSYSPYAATDRKVAHSARELFAELPIGAAKLGGKLTAGRALRTDYTLVGLEALPAGSTFVESDLKGPDCGRATHVVSKVYVGGFGMVAGQTQKIEAAASVFGAGGKVAGGSDAEHVAEEGTPEACDQAKASGERDKRCQVPLRIGLLPIEGRSAGGCPAGSTWDGKACVQTQVVTQISCPPGTTLSGNQCVGNVSTQCAAGLHFEAGKGCVPNGGAAPVAVLPSATGCLAGMAAIAGGSFKMGDRGDNVTVGAFCMDVTEITVDAYAVCVKAGKCSADHLGELSSDGQSFSASNTCNYGVSGRGNHPINCVDWGQAATFCHEQGKRLPSEEEWEWAARGESQGRVYPWGGATPDFQACWSGVNKRTGTCPVASFPDGDAPGGIHDLAGNVWEWTSSKYDASAARVNR
jgi:hypothetical protein